MHIFLWLFGLSVALYLAGAVVLTLFQRSFIYWPTSVVQRSDVIRSFSLESDDAQLQIWQINPGQGQAIIYFGGNCEKVALKAECWQTLFPNHTIYLNEYRGYGESTGKPKQTQLYQDALNLYDALAPKHQSVDVIGRSLGAAMAIYLAAHRKLGRLVLVTPFD
ncbi:MAG: alpha/beta hydrolase, partial [Proteobacteria bacterium]|nr:alpha/beta hydrolase [Pseudomonadota bacterium]